MKKVRLIAAYILSIPLIFFGGNYFIHIFEMPPPEEMNQGLEYLMIMRDSGFMGFVAAGHLICGIMLIIPNLRFLGALMHLPLSLGMFGFHFTLMPEGMGMVLPILILNVLVALNMDKIRAITTK